jgi:hypothetical protein
MNAEVALQWCRDTVIEIDKVHDCRGWEDVARPISAICIDPVSRR